MNEEENKDLQMNNSNSKIQNTAKDIAKKTGKEVVKKSSKKAVSSAATKSLLASMAPVIAIVAAIIVAIVIIIGIATFLMTMPGMAMAKLKEFAEDVGKSIASYFGGNEITFVEDEEIYEILDYFESMGYDLKGYGFLTNYTDKNENGELLDDEDDGVIRHTDEEKEGKIKEAESEFVFTYLVSDNYIYTVKNFNLDTQDENGKGFWSGLWTGLKGIGARALGRVISVVTLGTVNNFENEQWGNGMIALYYDKGLGVQGDFYGNGFKTDWGKLFKWPPEWPTEYNSIELDAEKKTLKIQRGLFGREIEYKLDGWTGRYGMPLEFLLSIHVGTMMPDLAFDMAETFPTEVKIFLHPQDDDGKTYFPYIAEVVDHWYRNTYFVKKMDKEIVTTDLDYEDIMRERWTQYETYEDGDMASEYKLYLINSKGEYATSENEIRNYDKASSKIVKEGNYFLFKGTQDEAVSYDIAVTKKAVTVDTTEMEDYLKDVGWVYNGSSNLWTAYDEKNGTLKQTGEGLRGETNPVIKKMFLYNTYFRYDGTKEVAEAITQLRNENNLPYGALDYTYDLDQNDDALKDVTTKVTINKDDKVEKKEYSLKDVSGKVSINQDALNAFSILENVHTLDTDYIYRDFKELVVELGYFTKEELTDETPKLLAWLIPGIGSSGYPKRFLDKKEDDFGTLAHSRQDYNAYNKEVGKKEESSQGEADPPSVSAFMSNDASDEWQLVDGTYAPGGSNFASTMGGNPGYYICNLEYEGVTYEVWQDATSMCTRYAFAFLASVYDCNDLTFSKIVDHDHGIAIGNGVMEGGGRRRRLGKLC